jgi:TP901 family phage tail tape measure protein
MADNEIINTLGFDVSQTLVALEQLDAKFASFGSRLGVVASQIGGFNATASSTVAAMQKIATQANATTAAMAKMGSGGSVDAALGIGKVNTQVKALQDAARLGSGTYGNAFQGMTNQANSAGSAVKKTTNDIQFATLTWQTFSRIIQTQALLRGFGMVRDAVEESFQSFKKFSTQISEIAAINPESNFAAISAKVREMSDAFNQPLDRTAEATYQVISDQFVSLADQTNILTAANQLAKTGAEDFAASAQLLTGALNAYNESSSMAGLRSAQFFETIKLGRLRAGELGTALGRIQAIGHELGVSLEELDASLIAITIGGVRASEAATQMRGVMSALLKPTDDMKKAFKELGVDSGTTAVATYGFQGTLNELWKAIDGNKSAAAKLFPNIRGLAGDFRLAGSGAQKFKEGLEALNKIDQTTLQKTWEQFRSSDVEKLTNELNKLKNFFTVDFGSGLVQQLNAIVNAMGGSSGLLPVLKNLTLQMPTDAVAMLGFAAVIAPFVPLIGSLSNGFAAAGSQMMLFGTQARVTATNFSSLRGILSTFALLELGKIIGNKVGDMAGNYLTAPARALEENMAAEIKFRQEKAEAATRIEQRQDETMVQGVRQLFAMKNVEYYKDVDAYNAATARIVKTTQTAFDKVLQARQKLTQELVAASEEAAKNAAGVPATRAGLQQEKADVLLKQRTEQFADPSTKYGQYAKAFQQAANEAQRLQGIAKDDQEQKLADAAWSRADAYKSLAQSAANESKNATAIRQANNLDIELINKKDAAQRRWGQTQSQVSTEMEARGRKSEQYNLDLEDKALEIQAKLKSLVGDKGARPSDEKFKTSLTEYARLTEEFKKTHGQAGQEALQSVMGDPKAFEAMQRQIKRSLGTVTLQSVEMAPEAIQKLRDKLKASYDKMAGEFSFVAKLEKVTGLSLFETDINKILDEAAAKFGATAGSAAKSAAAEADLATAAKTYKEARGALALPQTTQAISPVAGPGGMVMLSNIKPELNDAQKEVSSLINEMDRLAKSSTKTNEEINKAADRLNKVDWSGAYGMVGKVAASNQLHAMQEALVAQKLAQDRQKALPSTSVIGVDAQLRKEIGAQIEEPVKLRKWGDELERLSRLSKVSKQDLDSLNQQEQGINFPKAFKGQSQDQTLKEMMRLEQLKSKVQSKPVADSTQQSAQSASSMASALASAAQIDYSGLINQLNSVAQAMRSVSSSANQIPNMTASAASGGMMYYADGGRGTDTINARLTSGEQVMNVASSRRWFSQLQAMNAGMNPVYRNQGGPVTNAGIVGDVSINVSGGGSKQTGRAVADALNREIRKGSIRLRN